MNNNALTMQYVMDSRSKLQLIVSVCPVDVLMNLVSVSKYIILIELASRNFGVQINCFHELRNHSLELKVCATLEAIFIAGNWCSTTKSIETAGKCLTEREFCRHLRSTADCIQDMEGARTLSTA